MSFARPGQRRAPADETGALDNALGSAPIVNHDGDLMRLRHGLSAVYVRDTDPLSIAFRRMRRRRPLTGTHLAAYEAWLAQQRQDAAS